jgi:hypothetical protein
MKKILAGIAFFGFSITAFSQSIQMPSTEGLDSWEALITPQTTQHQLDSLTAAFKKGNFILSFTNVKFDSKGKLVKFKGAVTYNSPSKLPRATFYSDHLKSYEIDASAMPSIFVKGE